MGEIRFKMAEIIVIRPTTQQLNQLDLKRWQSWECEPSTFDWEYATEETAYVLEGKATVNTARSSVTFGKGDLVIFPKGLKCTWTVLEPIKKAYVTRKVIPQGSKLM